MLILDKIREKLYFRKKEVVVQTKLQQSEEDITILGNARELVRAYPMGPHGDSAFNPTRYRQKG